MTFKLHMDSFLAECATYPWGFYKPWDVSEIMSFLLGSPRGDGPTAWSASVAALYACSSAELDVVSKLFSCIPDETL